ncbi:hypothetical protein PUN28_011991 [Cardiocondyla obscurior]|uniref:Uncharacterized protein n=1 Tax=Cardiocondyla obscurior TaxID=286306 RepID=A0AAW2FEH1_9HYME
MQIETLLRNRKIFLFLIINWRLKRDFLLLEREMTSKLYCGAHSRRTIKRGFICGMT